MEIKTIVRKAVPTTETSLKAVLITAGVNLVNAGYDGVLACSSVSEYGCVLVGLLEFVVGLAAITLALRL
jgi:hypothetical protein